MTDNSRLSSTQALEDYFVDLLLEPEPEAAFEPALQQADIDTAEDRLEKDCEPCTDAVSQSGGEVTAEEAPRPGCQLSQDAGVLSPEPQQTLIPVAKPFDFASLDDNTEQPERSMPSPVLDNVQRLLNQVSRNNPFTENDDVKSDVKGDVVEDAVAQAGAEHRYIDDELADEWQQVMAHEQAHEQPLVSPQALVDKAVEETLVETQAGEDLPPDLWTQQVQKGNDFQALFFEVNGVTFAVPLTELGGIHQLGDMNSLLGRPVWYLGLMSSRDHQLNVVDTACWAMPDKLEGEEYREQYKYVVVLGESSWGLACNALLGTETLSQHSVRWREKAGKRPWLAGMVKEKMCALIHVSELISMLKAGLDVNTKLRQSC
ncbi:chemotaxis protein CheW [Photobacterium sp. ZSDE20]|uniref:Chemotaxis protein CheW n=1 Tax=Photobacterium pectinilyticum TaxID=2906793 RepID=A0ABT1N0R0_9GAMM|nr:chemotaxis protein CheW [Photobacterium sp. ZSDE20]MCQ1058326.1 chemotaxis protein CheW [Photobacterium sp. ZSDE20]MDD1823121.1 chemotaxis protein CheW [Photobacterium sp. ZSDE20]